MAKFEAMFLLIILVSVAFVVDIVHGSHIDCTAKETAKVYPYVFGMNQTVTDKTSNFQDGTNGMVDVEIENSITDYSLNTYVAISATRKCYFDATNCADQVGVAQDHAKYRGLAKVETNTRKITWKIGLTKLSLAENERMEPVAMALMTYQATQNAYHHTKLAVLYVQVWPNTASNNTDSRLTLRIFNTATGAHIMTSSMNKEEMYDMHFGKYINNRDMFYWTDQIYINLKVRDADSFIPRYLRFTESKQTFMNVLSIADQADGTKGEQKGWFITGFTIMRNDFQAIYPIMLIHSFQYKMHTAISTTTKFAWPRFSEVSGITAYTTRVMQRQYEHAVKTQNMGKTLAIAGIIGKITSINQIDITVGTQRSYDIYKEYWAMEGVTDTGGQQIYAQRFTFSHAAGKISGAEMTKNNAQNMDGGFRCLSPGFPDTTKIQLLDASYTTVLKADKKDSIWLQMIDDTHLFLLFFKRGGTVWSRWLGQTSDQYSIPLRQDLSYMSFMATGTTMLIIHANTKPNEGIFETTDGSKLGFAATQGVLFGFDEARSTTCMGFVFDLYNNDLNGTDSYQFATKADNTFIAAPAKQFGNYQQNTDAGACCRLTATEVQSSNSALPAYFEQPQSSYSADLKKEYATAGATNIEAMSDDKIENGLTIGNQKMTYCEHRHPFFELSDLKSYFAGDLTSYQSSYQYMINGFVADIHGVKSASNEDQIKAKIGYMCPAGGCVADVHKFCGYPYLTEQTLEVVKITDFWDNTEYTKYAHIEADVLILNRTGTQLTENFERTFIVKISLKLKSDPTTIVGEITQLMEAPPKQIKSNLQNCQDKTYGSYQVQSGFLPTNYTLETEIDGSNIRPINVSLPLHQYPVSCRIKTWKIEAYLPQKGSYVDINTLSAYKTGFIADQAGANAQSKIDGTDPEYWFQLMNDTVIGQYGLLISRADSQQLLENETSWYSNRTDDRDQNSTVLQKMTLQFYGENWDQTCSTTSCASYRGTQGYTESGEECQAWSKQTPNTHSYDITDTNKALESNYCRNPATSVFNNGKPWCFKASGTGKEECSLETKFQNLPKLSQTVKIYHCRTKWVDGELLMESILKEMFKLDSTREAYFYFQKEKQEEVKLVVDFESPNRCLICRPFYEGACEKLHDSTDIVNDWSFSHLENEQYEKDLVFKTALTGDPVKNYSLAITPSFANNFEYEQKGPIQLKFQFNNIYDPGFGFEYNKTLKVIICSHKCAAGWVEEEETHMIEVKLTAFEDPFEIDMEEEVANCAITAISETWVELKLLSYLKIEDGKIIVKLNQEIISPGQTFETKLKTQENCFAQTKLINLIFKIEEAQIEEMLLETPSEFQNLRIGEKIKIPLGVFQGNDIDRIFPSYKIEQASNSSLATLIDVKHKWKNQELTIIVDLSRVPPSMAGSRVSGQLIIKTSGMEEVQYPMAFQLCVDDTYCTAPPPKEEPPVVVVIPVPVKKPKVKRGKKLTAWIDDINELGNVTVFLNQPLNMKVLEKGSLDNETFEFSLEKGPTSKVLIEQLEFIWEFTSINETDGMSRMNFQVNFTNAIAVSNGEEADMFVIRFLKPEIFKGTGRGKNIIDEDYEVISYSIGRQMPNTKVSQDVDKQSSSATNGMIIGTILIFVGQIFVSGIAKQLIGAIVILQVVIHLIILNTQLPGNVLLTLKKVKPIAGFNLMKQLGKLNTLLFEYDLTTQNNLKQEHMIQPLKNLGQKSFNFVLNTGNMGQVLMIQFVLLFTVKPILDVVVYLAGSPKVIKKKEKFLLEYFDGKILTVAFAGFVPATISVYLSYDQTLFSTVGETVAQITAFFMFSVLFIYLPIVLVWSLTRDQEQLRDVVFKKRYGRTIQGIKTNTIWQRLQPIVFLGRRLSLICCGLFYYDQPGMQIVILLEQQILIITYNGLVEPLLTKAQNKSEMFQEVMFLVISYCLMLFTDWIPDSNFQYFLGWIFVGLVGILLGVNIKKIVGGAIKESWVSFKKYIAKYRRQRLQQMIQGKSTSLFDVRQAMKEEEKPKEAPKPVTPPKKDILSPRNGYKLRMNKRIKKTDLTIIKEEEENSDDCSLFWIEEIERELNQKVGNIDQEAKSQMVETQDLKTPAVKLAELENELKEVLADQEILVQKQKEHEEIRKKVQIVPAVKKNEPIVKTVIMTQPTQKNQTAQKNFVAKVSKNATVMAKKNVTSNGSKKVISNSSAIAQANYANASAIFKKNITKNFPLNKSKNSPTSKTANTTAQIVKNETKTALTKALTKALVKNESKNAPVVAQKNTKEETRTD